MSGLALRETAAGTAIPLRVKPRSGFNRIEGVRDGALLVSVRAAPADGEANAAVIATMAEALGCARSCVQLIKGHKSRDKTVLVSGQDGARVRALLGLQSQ